MNDLRERLARVEDFVGVPQSDGAENLAVQGEQQARTIAGLCEALQELSRTMTERFERVSRDVESLAVAVKDKLSDMETDVALVKKAMASGQSGGDGGPSQLKVPEPKAFKGDRNAKNLENFLWDMEQYFKAARTPEDEWVTLTSMYLDGDAKLWWRTRVQEDTSAGRPVIDSWAVLKKELKAQFLPCNVAWVARESLKNLKHSGTVRAYVTEFSSLMLDIQDMSEVDRLFNFMSGLQPWAQTELRRQGLKDLPTAMAAAEGLMDFGRPDGASNKKGTETRIGKPQENKNGRPVDGKKGGESSGTMSGESDPTVKSKGCFTCGGPHMAKNCPSKARLSAIFAAEAAREAAGIADDDEDVARTTALQVV